MAKLDQLDCKRFIKPLWSQYCLVGFAPHLKADRARKSRGKTPRANQLIFFENRELRCGQVAFILFKGFLQLYRYSHRADGKVWIIRLWQLGGADQRAIRIVIVDNHAETA